MTNATLHVRACPLIATSPEYRTFGDKSGVMLHALRSLSSLYQACGSHVQTKRSCSVTRNQTSQNQRGYPFGGTDSNWYPFRYSTIRKHPFEAFRQQFSYISRLQMRSCHADMPHCITSSTALPATSFPALAHRYLEHMYRIFVMIEAAYCARPGFNIGPSCALATQEPVQIARATLWFSNRNFMV